MDERRRPEDRHSATRSVLFAALAVSALCIIPSCSRGPDGSTWLIHIGDSTVTVAQAGEAWIRLTPGEQDYYLSRSNQFGDFIVVLARNSLFRMEIDRLGMLMNPELVSLGDAWARRMTESIGEEHFGNLTAGSVTDDEVTRYIAHIGENVWFTTDPGTSEECQYGPMHLPDMQGEFALLLYSMSEGDVQRTEDGTTVRLDSVSVTDPEFIAALRTGYPRITTYASEQLARLRRSEARTAVVDSILDGLSWEIRSDAVSRFCASRPDYSIPHHGDTMMVSSLGAWTCQDLMSEIALAGPGRSAFPHDCAWVENRLLDMMASEALLVYLESLYPGTAGSVFAAREHWTVEAASESLYSSTVSAMVEVTPEMILQEYEDLIEPPLIPGKRSIECVRIPVHRVGEYRLALSEGCVDSLLEGYGYWPQLSDDVPPSRITRPLDPQDVPGGNHNEVFSLEEGDTLFWSEPFPLVEELAFFAFRLVRVYPAHAASLEDISAELSQVIRARCEDERFSSWLRELEEYYDLRINEDLLSELPKNPVFWADL